MKIFFAPIILLALFFSLAAAANQAELKTKGEFLDRIDRAIKDSKEIEKSITDQSKNINDDWILEIIRKALKDLRNRIELLEKLKKAVSGATNEAAALAALDEFLRRDPAIAGYVYQNIPPLISMTFDDRDPNKVNERARERWKKRREEMIKINNLFNKNPYLIDFLLIKLDGLNMSRRPKVILGLIQPIEERNRHYFFYVPDRFQHGDLKHFPR